MIQIGMIGTSFIAHEFAESLVKSNRYNIEAVYSRSMDTAKEFGEPYHVEHFFDNLDEFFAHPQLTVVYIASPNGLHFEQAMKALDNGLHVIVEKPAFSNIREWELAFEKAKENDLYLFEAARHIHDPNFERIKEAIQTLPQVDGATLNFGKYSSRYDAVLRGEEPNIFSPRFSGGALVDLGIYSVYAALAWFGEPNEGHYFPTMLPTGVDGAGTAILRYDGFDVTLHVSKMTNLLAPSEIYSGQLTLQLDAVSTPTSLVKVDGRTNESEEIELLGDHHFMLDEAIDFADVIEGTIERARYDEWKELSHRVHVWVERLRKDAGIVFTAD